MLAIETFEFKLKSLSNFRLSADSTTLCGHSLGLATAFLSPRKRLRHSSPATAVSGIQRRNGLRWNALLMSLIQLLSHSSPESRRDISGDRLYAPIAEECST